MGAMKFDDELSRKIEALYLTPDVVEQRGQVPPAAALYPAASSAASRTFTVNSTISPAAKNVMSDKIASR